ncbi:MAG: hypothetical protein IH945_06020 [Armatimonadetes bacterium]|nr:hypothetical protein [Armatimonadota bacterium]
MTTLAAFAILVALPSAQETKAYRDDVLGLIIQHPINWSVKKRKYDTLFEFELADGGKASVQLFRTSFRQESDKWQELQRKMSEQMGRRMARQWVEHILGVPLLLSRIQYTGEDGDRTVLVGLLYTATKEKMNFRVNSAAEGADEAETAWRAALMSLRTTSGELPVAEDPTKPLPDPEESAKGQTVSTFRERQPQGPPVRTTNVAGLARLGRQMNIFMPNGWLLETDEDTVRLRHDKLKGSVRMSVQVGGRNQLPGVLRSAAKDSFDRFSLVMLRDEPKGALTKAGAFVVSSLRVGESETGAELCVWHTFGAGDALIWRIDYESSSKADYRSDRRLIRELGQLLAVEIVQ